MKMVRFQGIGVYAKGVDGQSEVESGFAEAVHEGVEHCAEGGSLVGEAGEGAVEEVQGAAGEEDQRTDSEVSHGN